MNEARPDQTAEVTSTASAPVSRSARHRVLLVEDHAALAEATAELLRFHGLEVRVATTGGDALAMTKAFDPVLILCDMMLPDMSGLDVALAVRATHDSNDVLIAVCSAMRADDLREIERHTKTRGIDLFLSKPLTNETLIGLLPRLEALRPC
jgi:CheY-like chemotaxis protein